MYDVGEQELNPRESAARVHDLIHTPPEPLQAMARGQSLVCCLFPSACELEIVCIVSNGQKNQEKNDIHVKIYEIKMSASVNKV